MNHRPTQNAAIFTAQVGVFYSASSAPLQLRGAPDIARILCWRFAPERHRPLRIKGLPKVPTWRLEAESNPRPFELKVRLSQCTTTSHCIVLYFRLLVVLLLSK